MAIITEGSRKAQFCISEANDWRSRDTVVVTVPANSTIESGTLMGQITSGGKYIAQLAAADDGSEDPAAILFAPQTNTTGSAVDVEAVVIIRDAEVAASELTYDPAANPAAITAANAALAAFGIIVR